MKIKILRIYEKNGIFRVETECKYGKDNLGLSLRQKYLDPVTDKPRYLAEVKSLLESKYDKQLATEKDIDDPFVGKIIDLEKI